ncbi:glycine zipper family protein [Planctomicrobium sp. SH668]|uniref:glycine zipper family protein n=1 Tax=Planctomicrobium sp. SH668 TaxID=3448126 RepID=UPI003F5C8E61
MNLTVRNQTMSCWVLVLAGVVATLLPGCANMNRAQSGALAGTALGTVAGAMIGGHNGSAVGGAMLGAATGAIAGGIIGDAEDARDQRDIAYAQRDGAIAQAQYVSHQKQQAITNFDLIRLTQSGVSDDVIINMIIARGGNFDMTTESVITLKNNGVSDQVILAAQQARAPVVTAAPSPEVVVVKQHPAVIVEPAPIYYGYGFGYHHHHRPYRHRHHGSHVGVHFGF